MDSRLLNVVYDDPFDGNYSKYDNSTEFWCSGSDTMGMQLTETLNGILPIAPTEDFHKDEHSSAINLQNNKNMFNYEDFTGQHLASGDVIEIVTVDPNTDGYDTDSEDEKESDGGDNDNDLLDFERQSQYSNATFRTRTDSSSIGDYESHTSDYDDDDEVEDKFNNASFRNFQSNSDNSNILAPDDLLFDTYHKSRTLSTNTISSDVDGLGLQIDANSFDLAEFITKDDFQLRSISSVSNAIKINGSKNVLTNTDQAAQVFASKNTDSDSDSDVIVDVETVEIDGDEASCLKNASETLKPLEQPKAEDVLTFVDNVKSDPSWTPTLTIKKVESQKFEEQLSSQKPNFIRNFPLVPNKKQCDLLKGKFAKSKGKPLQKSAKTSIGKNKKIENSPVKNSSAPITTTSKPIVKIENSVKKNGIGMGSKNVSLLKHERVSMSEDANAPIKYAPSDSEQKSPTTDDTPAQKAQDVKRKLNLDEYKRRRGVIEAVAVNSTALAPNTKLPCKIAKLEINIGSQISNINKPNNHTTPVKKSEAVTSVVKTLKQQNGLVGMNIIDPIAEARNKVLRMQELKKAQQMRIIDSTISAKVPRVTKLFPLREIVKDSFHLHEEENKSLLSKSTKSDYEEIIIVSVSCNTDISLPPILNPDAQSINNATRSLLKSSALLSTITNTFEKVKATDNTKLSTSSLIASIQDVVVKKALPLEETCATENFKDVKNPEHHGEDKIIMHLRKDRMRKHVCSIGVQTDLQPEFPPLLLAKPSIQHKSRERTHRHRKRQYRKRSHLSSSPSSESYSDDHSDNSNSSTISRLRDNSSSSLERTRTYDSAIGTGGYSSRSSLRHRSSISSSYSESTDRMARSRRQRRTSYTKRSAARKRSHSSHSSSSSYSSDLDRSRSPFYRRSRSPSTPRTGSRSRRSSYRQSQTKSNSFLDRNVSQPAVEERRIVYVGRIEQETTKDMLRRKFLQYGIIKQISIHFKDTGMKYGFVTFERSQDAFAAIDNSARDPQINMYDISFGGRRAFCRASYADLDNAGINTYQSYVFPQPVKQPKEEDSFEALLMKMKAKLNANKTNTTTKGTETTAVDGKNIVNNKI